MDVSEDKKKDGSSSSSTMFMWRIQSFSAFSKLKLDKHYSGVFSAGGFTWRLLVYPKGNNADDFLSLYLELVESLASPSSSSSSFGCSDIFADYTLSLLDQSSFCQHRTISGTWERFTANRRCVGFESFIPLGDFNSPSKGYLVEDTCLFQAKLTIHGEGTTNVGGNWVCLTLEEAIPTRFSWKIDEFSKLDAIIKPELFTAGNYKWIVILYLKGKSTQAESPPLFLAVAKPDKLSPDWEVYAEFSLSLVDQIQGRNTVIKSTQHWFLANEIGWVWPRCIALNDFNDPTKGFLINDTCIIEAEISVPRIVNYCSFEPKKQKSCERCCLAEATDSPPCKFSWSIDKFSQINTYKIESEDFTSEGYKWRLLLFPRRKNLDQLSLYLKVVESENLPSGWRIYAQFKLTVINLGNGALTTTKDGWHQFYAHEIRWGFREFMPLSVLFDKSRGYFTDDKLQVEAEVTVHRGLDYWMYCSREVTGYVGLNGSSSPLNCYLQILYHIPFFRKAVLHVLGSGSYESSLQIIPAMRHLFQKLESSGICVSSNHFNRHFGSNAHGSSIWRDMHEMIRTLFRELEAEIRGNVIGDKVKQLFAVEFTKSPDCFTGNSRTGERRVEMISENYNSGKRESSCDLLLDVKGCRDVYSSFDLILTKDKLDVTPKYCSKQQSSQDASNGVLFVKFPPILQLVLKRFEFDNLQNTTVKIDDLYNFPFQLDLGTENGKYFSSDTVQTIRNLYTLHSIVVHKGSFPGGHFYCLIRPNLTDQWLKFEDGRVTKEDLNLLSENLCSGVGEAICPNVCMLVYICEGDKELIFTSDAEVDCTKMASFDNGWKEPESKKKNRSDEFMYRIIKVSQHKDFTYQIGKEIYFDLVDHENVCSFRVRKDMPFIQFKDELAKEFGIDVRFQRFWLWSMHPNGMYRPCRLLTPQEELQSIGMLGEINILVDLNLFLEVELGPDLKPIPPLDRTEDDILLFFKLYDPRIEELRYVGRLYVKASDKPADILVKLNNMARLTDNEEIDLFKEAGFEPTAICEHVDKERTFRDNMLKDGSIICYQATLPIEERNRCLHPDVHSFLKFVRGHQMWDRKRCAKLIDERDALLFHAQKVISDLTNRAGGSVGS